MLVPNTKPETQEYYHQALSILKDHGFIESKELIKVFHNMNLPTILLCFDRNEEPLFKDYTIKIHGYVKIRIYKRLKPIYNRWEQEAKHLVRNGCMGRVGRNI